MESKNKIPVEVSVRHLHLSQKDLWTLFGDGHNLSKHRELSQHGEFAAKEVVTLIGPTGRVIENVRIVGPCRKRTQVEVSRTDSFRLGVNAPLRLSGDLEGAGQIKIKGPRGEVDLDEGVIVAKRHLHISPVEADELGLRDGNSISVRINTARPTIFNEVVVRVDKDHRLALHLDSDEGNAAWVEAGTTAEII